MRIGRTLSPAAAPIDWRAFSSGLRGLLYREPELRRFADELKAYFGCRHCFLLSSGKAALTVTLLALRRLHPERDRVLIPALTCYSVPSAIIRAGLEVALCDIAPGSYDFDPDRLRVALDDSRLLCVVPTHLFGCAADIQQLRDLAQDRNLPIIEDAAQALGAHGANGMLGTAGDVGLFSLGRGKALSTVEGGILLTDDDRLAAAIGREIAVLPAYSGRHLSRLLLTALALKLLGTPWMYWLPKSLPFLRLGETRFEPDFPMRPMSGFQAGLSRNWPTRIDRFQQQRRRNAACWAQLTATSGTPPYPASAVRADLLRFPILCRDALQRQQMMGASERRGLGLAPVYPQAIGDIEALRGHCSGGPYPVAQQLVDRLLTLPVHPLVSDRDRRRMARLFTDSVSRDQLDALPRAGRAG